MFKGGIIFSYYQNGFITCYLVFVVFLKLLITYGNILFHKIVSKKEKETLILKRHKVSLPKQFSVIYRII